VILPSDEAIELLKKKGWRHKRHPSRDLLKRGSLGCPSDSCRTQRIGVRKNCSLEKEGFTRRFRKSVSVTVTHVPRAREAH
jgi:hypothetical protein